MLVDLIRITAADGMELDGAFFAPETDVAPAGPIDAAMVIHGSGRNFYTPATANMANDLRNAGYAALTLNTRGHDTVWVDRQTGVAEGNAYEILDNGRQDLRAGIDYLEARGYRRIAILGQSMGAVKVAYYGAVENDPRVAAVVPISPVRLSCFLLHGVAGRRGVPRQPGDRGSNGGGGQGPGPVLCGLSDQGNVFGHGIHRQAWAAGTVQRRHARPEDHGAALRPVRFAGNAHPSAGCSAGYGRRRREQPSCRIPGIGWREPFPDQHDAGGRRSGGQLASLAVC